MMSKGSYLCVQLLLHANLLVDSYILAGLFRKQEYMSHCLQPRTCIFRLPNQNSLHDLNKQLLILQKHHTITRDTSIANSDRLHPLFFKCYLLELHEITHFLVGFPPNPIKHERRVFVRIRIPNWSRSFRLLPLSILHERQ